MPRVEVPPRMPPVFADGGAFQRRHAASFVDAGALLLFCYYAAYAFLPRARRMPPRESRRRCQATRSGCDVPRRIFAAAEPPPCAAVRLS